MFKNIKRFKYSYIIYYIKKMKEIKDVSALRVGEYETVCYYKEKGYSIYRFIIHGKKSKETVEKGTPDFFVVKGNEKFYVEEKTDNMGFSIEQDEVIDDLIERGNKVILARYNSRRKMLVLCEIVKRKIIDRVFV